MTKRYLVYNGPSMLEPETDIIAVLRDAGNTKTGKNDGTWELSILPWDVHGAPFHKERPNDSHRSVCGDCPFGGRYTGQDGPRTCYVDPRGPNGIYDAIDRGSFEGGDIETVRQAIERKRIAPRMLRLGSWGDPTAIPVDIVTDLIRLFRSYGARHVGYTHQWRAFPEWAGLVMASCDADDRSEARALGWQAFTVTDNPSPDDIVCPASDEWEAETGRKTVCARCRLCDGARASVTIQPHGAAFKV